MFDAVFGTALGMFFFTLNLVEFSLYLSGPDILLSYYRAYPLPILGKIKMAMVVLVPLLLLDLVGKVRAFMSRQTRLTFIGLLNACAILTLFHCITQYVAPSEEAVLAPMTVKGKKKIAAYEATLVEDLYVGICYMLCVNLALLVLPLVQLKLSHEIGNY